MDLTSYAEAANVHRAGEGEFTAVVPEGWEQGRGCFGGVVLGIATRAMLALEDQRPLRGITADFAAPIGPGPITVGVTTVRRGTSSTLLRATLGRDGEELASVTGFFGGPRVPDRDWRPAPVAAQDWASTATFPLGHGVGPRFARGFEYRPIRGMPVSAGSAPDTIGFVRHATPHTADLPALVALTDAWWPSGLVVERELRPIVTATLVLQIVSQPTETLFAGPLLHQGAAIVGTDGYFTEHGTLWTPSGELVTACTQLMVYLR